MKKLTEGKGLIWMLKGGLMLCTLLVVAGMPIQAMSVDRGLADSAWPMFQHDLGHTGLSPYVGPEVGVRKWVFSTGGAINWGSATIATDGTIYTGSGDGKLYAINPDGTEKWAFDAGGGVKCTPTLCEDGTVYIGSMNGWVYAVNPDGTQKWAFDGRWRWGRMDWMIGSDFPTSPAVAPDGTIYIAARGTTGGGRLYALNQDGTEKWHTSINRPRSSPAIGSDGTIYVAGCGPDDSADKLYAFNPDGTVKWSISEAGGVWSSPAIGSDGTIYIGTLEPGGLWAFNPDGTSKWTFDTGYYVSEGGVYGSPAIGSDGTIYVGTRGGKFYAINPDGTEKWSLSMGGVYGSAVIDSNETIYIGSCDKNLYALNPDGTVKWTFVTGAEVCSSAAIDSEGTIYFGSNDGKLYAIYAGAERPDLKPISITTPDTIESRDCVSVTVRLENIGNADSGSFDIALYANGDLIDTQNVASMASGADIDVSFSWSPASAGVFTLKAIVDADNSVAESEETNNELSKKNITVWGPGLPEVQWEFSCCDGCSVSTVTTTGDGMIYIGSDEGKLYAINPDGTAKWEFVAPAGSVIRSRPAVATNGTIYITVSEWDKRIIDHKKYRAKYVYAIDADNGLERWRLDIEETVDWRVAAQGVRGAFMEDTASPIVAPDGTIYLAGGEFYSNLCAISPDGTLKWKFEGWSTGGTPSAAIGPGGTIYFGGSHFYGMNPDGTIKWEIALPGWVSCAPSVGPDGTIYFGDGNRKVLYAFRPDGTTQWEFAVNTRVNYLTIADDGTIYVGADKLYALNPDGIEKWMFLTDDSISSAPVVDANDNLYVGAGKKLYAINADGIERWEIALGSVIRSVATDGDGTLYVASEDGRLYSLEMMFIVPGDLDGDGDVDRDDLNIILAARNTPATGPYDPRDLDGDGMITALDARKLVTLCTRTRCACE